MAKRPVPEVVEEPRDSDAKEVTRGDLELGLRAVELEQEPRGEMAYADAVLKPLVRCSGVRVLAQAELLEVAKPLKLSRVDQLAQDGMEVELVVARDAPTLASWRGGGWGKGEGGWGKVEGGSGKGEGVGGEGVRCGAREDHRERRREDHNPNSTHPRPTHSPLASLSNVSAEDVVL